MSKQKNLMSYWSKTLKINIHTYTQNSNIIAIYVTFYYNFDCTFPQETSEFLSYFSCIVNLFYKITCSFVILLGKEIRKVSWRKTDAFSIRSTKWRVSEESHSGQIGTLRYMLMIKIIWTLFIENIQIVLRQNFK